MGVSDGNGAYLDDVARERDAERSTLQSGAQVIAGGHQFELFESAAAISLDADVSIFVGTSEPFDPYDRVRIFSSFAEAKRFCLQIVKHVASPATLRPRENQFQVTYRSDSSNPLPPYRDRCRYSDREEHFIIDQYMMWTPLSELARRLDRKNTAVAAWLVNRGYRLIYRDPAYGVGALRERATAICRELCRGVLVYDSAKILVDIGVIRELTLEQSDLAKCGCGLAFAALTDDDKMRVLRFALDYNELRTAYMLALDIGWPGRAYILALQFGDPFRALVALKRMRSSAPKPRAALTATADFLRFELTTTLPEFLRKWFDHADARRTSYESSRWDARSKGHALIERLLAVLEVSASEWPTDLVTIVRIIKHGPYTLEELRRSSNHLAAWLSADLIRFAAARAGGHTERGQQAQSKLAAFAALAGNFVPNLPQLLADLSALLTYDHDLAGAVNRNMSGAGPYFVEPDKNT